MAQNAMDRSTVTRYTDVRASLLLEPVSLLTLLFCLEDEYVTAEISFMV